MRRAVAATVLSAALCVTVSPPADALSLMVSPCAGNEPLKVLAFDPNLRLESITVDPRGDGALYLSDFVAGRILAMDAPTASPRELVRIPGPGGLLWLDEEERLLAGYGNVLGATEVGVATIDTEAGAVDEVLARGLHGSNGLAITADGTIYGSDASGSIDRVAPDGTVTSPWASLPSPNGMAVDPSGRYLYANQTLSLGTTQRIDLENPASRQTWFTAPVLDALAGLDGLSVDASGRLYAAAYTGMAVVRIGADGKACTLARDPRLAGVSMVAQGRGGAFPTTSLYATTHLGFVIELPHAIR